MGRYELLLNHGYYRDVFNYYKKSEEYQRQLALGITLESDYPKDIFVSIPKDNIVYQKYGIHNAEIYLGNRHDSIDGVVVDTFNKDKFYMDYDYRNFIDCRAWTGEWCDYIITDINPRLKDYHLYYYYGMQFLCDLCGFSIKNNVSINIKSLDCLKSIYNSNVRLDTPLLRAYSFVNKDYKEDLYNYFNLLIPDILYNSFTKRLKSGILYLEVPVSGNEIEWSVDNISLTMDLLLYYIKLLGESGAIHLFNQCIISLNDINDNLSLVSLDSLSCMDNIVMFKDIFNISSLLTNEFIDFIFNSSGIKIVLNI